MEKKENDAEAAVEIAETPALKYYGWKTMPYVIGFKELGAWSLELGAWSLELGKSWGRRSMAMKHLRSLGVSPRRRTCLSTSPLSSTSRAPKLQLSSMFLMELQALLPSSAPSSPTPTWGATRLWALLLQLLFWCLDKAAILANTDEIKQVDTATNNWRLCSKQQVEEVKCLLRIVPIWSTGILYYVGMAQQSTYVVLQAMQSDRHLGSKNFEIPAGSFSIFSLLALSIWLPIYDSIVIPWIRKVTKKEEGISMLKRMGIGMVISIIAMIVSGLVEERRRYIALHEPTIGISPSGGAISSFSSLWLVPQLMLSGLAEAFCTIGQMQFYYKEFPEHMRSVAGCLFFCTVAFSNYLSGFLVTIIHRSGSENGTWLAGDLNKGRLENFYFLIAGIGVVNFTYFLVSSKWYKYKGSEVSQSQKAISSESQPM